MTYGWRGVVTWRVDWEVALTLRGRSVGRWFRKSIKLIIYKYIISASEGTVRWSRGTRQQGKTTLRRLHVVWSLSYTRGVNPLACLLPTRTFCFQVLNNPRNALAPAYISFFSFFLFFFLIYIFIYFFRKRIRERQMTKHRNGSLNNYYPQYLSDDFFYLVYF